MAKKKEKKDRTAIIERNKSRRRKSEAARRERLIGRTHALVGQHVAVRVKGYARPLVGTVLEVLTTQSEGYPHDAKRHHGNYLKIRTAVADVKISRHRVKVIKDKPNQKETNAV